VNPRSLLAEASKVQGVMGEVHLALAEVCTIRVLSSLSVVLSIQSS